MADNTTLNSGTGGDVISTDDIAGVKVQRVKVQYGADGSATDVDSTHQLPVLATDAGDVAHDGADSGNPVKVGGKAASAFPTAVSTGDRTNLITDLWGRPLVSHIDPAMQVWKAFNATTTQTGGAVWTPAGGKRIAITHLIVGTYGTTAARLILWFGAAGDTTYTAGTDELVVAASFAPGAFSKPGLVLAFPIPIFCATADYVLRCTTDAALSHDIAVRGYEF